MSCLVCLCLISKPINMNYKCHVVVFSMFAAVVVRTLNMSYVAMPGWRGVRAWLAAATGAMCVTLVVAVNLKRSLTAGQTLPGCFDIC